METREFLARNPILTRLKSNAREWLGLAEQPPGTAPCRLISVIVPAHNEERYLAPTLQSLHRQNYRHREVIVVANGCTDHTAEVGQRRCDRLIVLSQKSLGVARNLGARMAKGEILVFLDADTELEPMSLRRIAEEFKPGIAAATLRGRPDRTNLRYRLVYWLKNFVHRFALHTGSSGVIVCWRDDFIRAGGFDEGLEVRENSELIRRLLRHGRYKYVADVSATTSMRRYERQGVLRLGWLWLKLWLHSLFGDLHRRRYEIVR